MSPEPILTRIVSSREVRVFDLNPAERRALAGATCLIGLGLLGRAVLAPGPGAFDWRPASGPVEDLPSLTADVGRVLERERRAGTPLAPGERIDPNGAPVEELRRLPGVGPRLAEAIVRERSSRPFSAAADLERVPGIGPVTASRLAPHLALGGAPGAQPGAASRPAPSVGGCEGEGRIDVNRASESDLDRLPGVGPVLARRIVERRRVGGPFAELADLAEVRGLATRSVERLRGAACAGRP